MIALDSLSYVQTIDLLENALNAFRGEDEDRPHPEETVHEIVDAWIPVYYYDIREAWALANCPEPDDIGSLADATGIHHAMQMGLYEVAFNQLYLVTGQAFTHGEAADAISAELSLLTES